MDRKDYVLAVLSSAKGGAFTPVQVQKLFFLLDKEISNTLNNGVPYFNFEPYDYGPFDASVYHVINALEQEGLAETLCTPQNASRRQYRLSVIGQEKGEHCFSEFDSRIQDYIIRLTRFVRRLSFKELVIAIYNKYPEMRENSIFRG